MKITFQVNCIARALGVFSWGFAVLVLLTAPSGTSLAGSPDPLLAAGEQALVGSYKLDHVLLAPGKLVLLPNGNPMFEGMGDTPEQAAAKGLVNAKQVAVLQRQDCTMTVLPDHSFVITNLLYMANWHSSGDWQFKQSVAMPLPRVILKAGWLRCWAARFLPGCVAR